MPHPAWNEKCPRSALESKWNIPGPLPRPGEHPPMLSRGVPHIAEALPAAQHDLGCRHNSLSDSRIFPKQERGEPACRFARRGRSFRKHRQRRTEKVPPPQIHYVLALQDLGPHRGTRNRFALSASPRCTPQPKAESDEPCQEAIFPNCFVEGVHGPAADISTTPAFSTRRRPCWRIGGCPLRATITGM